MSEWIKVEDGLPQKCDPVIAFGINSSGKKRTIRAAYARKFELEANDDCLDDEWAEYSDERDEFYAPEGWYEWSDSEEIHWRVDFPITHWMPIPTPPKDATP